MTLLSAYDTATRLPAASRRTAPAPVPIRAYGQGLPFSLGHRLSLDGFPDLCEVKPDGSLKSHAWNLSFAGPAVNVGFRGIVESGD